MLDRITPVILTRNEEPNIERTLGQLRWASEVVVIDSESTDATAAIARRFPNVQVLERAFDSHAAQWTYGVEQASTEWVLTLDADYFVSEAFVAELGSLRPDPGTAGYEAAFVYAIGGRPLRASLYPPRSVLLRRGAFEFYQDGHTQRVRLQGTLGRLRQRLVHDDRKDRKSFAERQRVYMRAEAAKLRATPFAALPWPGRIRRLRVIAPLAILVHTLLWKRTILDGRAGFEYARERFLAELLLSRELFRRADGND